MNLSKYMVGVAILFVGLLICGSLDFDGIAQEMAVVDDGAPVCVNGQCPPQVTGQPIASYGSVTTYSSSSSCGVSQTVRQRAGFFRRVGQRGGLFARWRQARVARWGCGG